MSYKQIREAAILRTQTLLPSYSLLKNQIVLEDNTEKQLNKGISVIWGSSNPVTGPLRKLAFNSILSIILTNQVETRSNDDVAPMIDDLYLDVEKILRSFFNATYLGIPSVIRGIPQAYVAKPYLMSSNRFCVIQIDFTIDFTLAIND